MCLWVSTPLFNKRSEAVGNNKRTLTQQAVEEMFFKNGLRILEPYVNSRTRIKAECLNCGNIVSPFYRQIWAGQSGCRNCSSNKFRMNDKQISNLLGKFNLLKIGEYVNSKTPFECECRMCGKKVSIVVMNIRSMKTYSCVGCDPNGVTKKVSLNSQELEIVEKIFTNFGFKLLDSYKGSTRRVRVKHLSCGSESLMSLKNIRNGAGFCSECVKTRKLSDEEALKVLTNAGFLPLEKYPGSEKPWKSQCINCKRTLTPTVHVLKSKKSGCAYCSRTKIDPKEAEDIMIKAGYLPLESYKTSKSKWKCKHELCGNIVFPRLNGIQMGQGGCTSCSHTFSYHDVSYFYFMENRFLESFKIGISNSESRDDRIARHAKSDWKLLKKIEFESGWLAYDMEQTILNEIRNQRGIPIHLSKSEMPQGGYSETFSSSLISIEEVMTLIKDFQKGNLVI